MKHFLYLAIFFLVIPIIVAQVNLITPLVAPGEIFQAEVIGEKLLPADIRLLNPYGYPTIFGINFIVLDENYYLIYTPLPENSQIGIYTLKIKDEDYKFQIIQKNSYATFSPVFIKYKNKEEYIKIKLTNHGLQEKEYIISSSYDAVTPSVNSLIIPPKSSKYFYTHFNPEKIKKSLIASLLINDYTIPIYIIKDVFPTQVISRTTVSEEALIFYTKKDEEELKINYVKNTLTEQRTLEDELFIKNNLNSTIENLSISLTGNLDKIIKLDKYQIEKLEPEESIALQIIVNEDKELTENVYDGSLLVGSAELPMHFDVEEIIEIEEEPEPLIEEEKTEEIPEEKPPEKKSYAKYFAYLLIIILAAILYYYYFGKKEHKKQIKFTEYIKKFKS